MPVNHHSVFLASQSPRRAELLQQIDVNFETLSVAVDEAALLNESPRDYVHRIAIAKARAGWSRVKNRQQGWPVLAADTCGVLDGQILCKPTDKTDGLTMLRKMSGRSHQILTAVCVRNETQQLMALSVTDVRFRKISDEELEAYWHSGEPQDKAGAYGIQGLAAVFVDNINGSYSGVVGLPLAETWQLLEKLQKAETHD